MSPGCRESSSQPRGSADADDLTVFVRNQAELDVIRENPGKIKYSRTGGSWDDKHFLFYLYTIQSKSSTDRISEFSVVTLLDDRQIDSYSSTDGVRTPKQAWMKEMKESEWKEGTDKLKYDGHQLNKILDNQMKTFRHNEPDGHTLQWRVGCEGEKHSDGSVSVLDCINEYGYDGQSLISYDWTSRKWSAPVSQDGVTEEWNAGRGQNAVQRCEECVVWLKIYLQYNTTETKQNEMDVYVFAKRSVTDLKKQTLTCLATGFYPKDVEIKVRKFNTSLPEHLLRSSGVRPNDDGTYQLRKSVDIQEDDTADYDCYVTHSSISTPVIKQWDGKCRNCHSRLIRNVIVGLIIGVIILAVLAQLAVLSRITCVCKTPRRTDAETPVVNSELLPQSAEKSSVQSGGPTSAQRSVSDMDYEQRSRPELIVMFDPSHPFPGVHGLPLLITQCDARLYKHSLRYVYNMQSKSSTDRIYDFRAVTLLDDRQIDSYSSTDGVRTPKQDWMKKMKEMKDSEWTAGTDKLKNDGQWVNKILDNQMKAFGHDESDGHTLQWRIGCEVEKRSDGSVLNLNLINEYTYDGQKLISYNWTLNKWSCQAKKMEEEWNARRGQIAGWQHKECVDWLMIYLQYNTTETKQDSKCSDCQSGPSGGVIEGKDGEMFGVVIGVIVGVIVLLTVLVIFACRNNWIGGPSEKKRSSEDPEEGTSDDVEMPMMNFELLPRSGVGTSGQSNSSSTENVNDDSAALPFYGSRPGGIDTESGVGTSGQSNSSSTENVNDDSAALPFYDGETPVVNVALLPRSGEMN
ncbi:hypothetical protein MHYP_G00169990 [Metynnis hypsauchen]